MKDYDAMEQAYKNGYMEGFRDGVMDIENWLREKPIHVVLEVLQNKETLFWAMEKGK